MRAFFLLILFLLTGCSVKTTPIYVVLKTPKFRFADEGFLKEGFGYKEIVIYKAGMKPFNIELKNSYVCLDGFCMDKKRFIKKYLGKNYPSCFFECLLNKKPLLNFGRIKKIKDGFIQKNDRFFYFVGKNKILFKDRKNQILILLKYLKG